jgi:hemolysin activation/secretion protein
MKYQTLLPILVPSALALTSPAFAQAVPNAGQVLREIGQAPVKPHDERTLDLEPSTAAPQTNAGTATAVVDAVSISGNTLFKSNVLQAELGDFKGRPLTLADMRALCEKIAAYYRRHGYPFTKVVLPPQDIVNGMLRIQVVEGRYGKVVPGGDPTLARGATPFLGSLHTGDFIEANRLERTVLILDDEPGMTVRPTISPGADAGTGDFAANIRRVRRFGGDIGADDAGGRYVGTYRAKFNAYAYSPFLFGDQVTARGLYSERGMWLGSLDYELPLNGSGLRGQIAVADTNYQLGDQFRVLGAAGYVKSFDARLKYPIIRSRSLNLTIIGGAESKYLEDRFSALGVVNHKSSLSWPVMLQFDDHDRVLGGGVTYGFIGIVYGKLRLNTDLAQADASTARTDGAYSRVNIDVSRVQALKGPFTLYGRVSAQWANKNLDSSEKFVLGGSYGVRAFPVGEALSDNGWLLQTEARWDIGPLKPYLLFDTGRAEANAKPWDASSHGHRDLTAAGLGLRVNYHHWRVDGSMAWQVHGGPATSEGKNVNPHPWIDVDYQF